VFAFAVTLTELLARLLMADRLGLGSGGVGALAGHAARVAEGWRPSLPAWLPEQLSSLIQSCWAQASTHPAAALRNAVLCC